MTDERWLQVERLFHAALMFGAAEREDFLAASCGDDGLRAEVGSLLAAHERAGDFIESSIFDAGFEAAPGAMTGKTVGHYRLIREIGRGGMGTVWLAERADDQFDKRVAIKLVRRGLDTDDILRRFRAERQILASLEHQNIARLLDGGATEDGLPYLVMEYIEGEPIDRYCDRRGLSITERLKLFREVCAAVQYAHQNLVIHRDLKPGNVLVTETGAPKLLDFGIARLLDPERAGASSQRTLTRGQMMTPDYASPEQVRGQTMTTASDVYALGVLLYELLTGRRPYRLAGCAPQEIERIVCETEPERPSLAVNGGREGKPEKLRRHLAGDLDNIALMALRKEPARRYASVEQFSEDIRRHLAGLPVIARKDTLGYRGGKFIRRHKAGLAAAAMIIISLLAGLLATAWQARVARSQQALAEQSRLAAETALAQAEAQRVIAEERRAEAELQRALAEAERARAKMQQARAERRSNDLRLLAGSFMTEILNSIKNLPGSTRAQSLLVGKALEHLDSLAKEAGHDPSLRRDLAIAYEKVGDIQGASNYGDLGSLAGALQSYRKALGIRQSLARGKRGRHETQVELAACQMMMGNALWTMKKIAEAQQTYRQALKVYQSLPERLAGRQDVRRQLVILHERLGLIQRLSGDEPAAMQSHQRAKAIFESWLIDAQVENTDYLRLAYYQRQSGDLAGAMESQRKRQAAALAKLKKNPNDLMARRGLGGSHLQIGQLLAKSRDHAAAVAEFRQALAILKELSERDSDNIRARRDVSACHRLVGQSLRTLGDRDGALEHFRRTVEIDEALLAAHPEYEPTRSQLALSYLRLGATLGELGQPEAAIASRRKGLALKETMAALNPANMPNRASLADAYSDTADLLRRIGRKAEALELYRRALELADSTTGGYRKDIRHYHYRIGELLAQSGDFKGGLDHFRRSIALCEEWAAREPVNVDARLSPTFAYTRVSEVYATLAADEKRPAAQRLADWREARAWQQRRQAILLDLRERGLLPAKHQPELEGIAHEIARYDGAIARLSGVSFPPGKP